MIAWLQCPAGASGDMLLGAFLDAGAPLERVRSAVDALDVERIEIATRVVTRHGIAATQADVRAPAVTATRSWADVRALLEGADLPEPVRALALDVFARLARAEARVHATLPETVHFHEVGALDALADIVGSCAALHALGVTELTCSPVALGVGTSSSEHGVLPVPAPAVLELLREVDALVYTTDIPYELCTPTGAALLSAMVTQWGGMPAMRIRAAGAGAGTRDLEEVPNLARAVVGEPTTPAAQPQPDMLLFDSNVDDLDPRLWPTVLDRLLAAGAVDAWLTPILMKKGRPAHTLSVLVEAGRADAVRREVFRETSTLGLRERHVERSIVARAVRSVEVGGVTIGVKLAYLDGALINAQPEYEDVTRAAASLDRPIREVLAAASAAAREL